MIDLLLGELTCGREKMPILDWILFDYKPIREDRPVSFLSYALSYGIINGWTYQLTYITHGEIKTLDSNEAFFELIEQDVPYFEKVILIEIAQRQNWTYDESRPRCEMIKEIVPGYQKYLETNDVIDLLMILVGIVKAETDRTRNMIV